MNKIRALLSVALLTVICLMVSPVEAITTKDLDMQVNVKDIVAPPNVSNFTATPGDRHITLTWDNPSDADFAGVIIQRSLSYYPASVSDGERIYQGSSSSFVDTGLSNGTQYFYTAFSYDAAGNYSSGAICSATPNAPSVTKEVSPEAFVIPNTPAVAEPGRKENLDIVDFNFYLMMSGGPLQVGPNDLQELVVIKRATLLVTVSTKIFAKDVNVITITLGGSSYLFKRNDADNRFEAAFVLPPVKGDYNATIVIVYKDGTVQTLQSKFVVDPYGYIYEKYFSLFGLSLGGETRVSGASVTLYQKIAGKWKKWAADEYNQKNPIVTDKSGEYTFLAPNGSYYLEVIKSGHKTYKSEEFQVSDKAMVNKNIQIEAYWKYVVMVILILAAAAALLLMILRRRRRK